MRKTSFVDSKGNMWTRVNRARASRLFDEGHNVAMCPVNVNPRGPLGYHVINPLIWPDHAEAGFERLSNSCEAHECNGETGRYLAYYVSDGPSVSIRAPRFSSGGSGYVTADTIEVYINGYRLKNHEWYDELQELARGINRGEASPLFVHSILDPIAHALVGRVAW